MAKSKTKPLTPGAAAYLKWKEEQWADPEFRAIYEEEAPKIDLWLQLVDARRAAGLTQKQLAERMGISQAQVARIEKDGYDAYTLNTLRKYIAALGEGYSLAISIQRPTAEKQEESQEPQPMIVQE